jgi:hypothetical protein
MFVEGVTDDFMHTAIHGCLAHDWERMIARTENGRLISDESLDTVNKRALVYPHTAKQDAPRKLATKLPRKCSTRFSYCFPLVVAFRGLYSTTGTYISWVH